MSIAVEHVAFDAVDALALAQFWSEALERPMDEGATPAFASIGFRPQAGGLAFLFQQVPEARAAKNRVHVDTKSGPAGRAAEVARLLGLGASLVGEHDEWGHQWSVLEDPEGNVFCVS